MIEARTRRLMAKIDAETTGDQKGKSDFCLEQHISTENTEEASITSGFD